MAFRDRKAGLKVAAPLPQATSAPAAEPRGVPPGFFDALGQGILLCSSCGHRLPLAHQPPLALVECPACRHHAFVPMSIAGYWLFEPIGGGGAGTVYKACRADRPGQVLAAKIATRAATDRAAGAENLASEARVAKTLGQHPNLVSWVESGWLGTEFYYIMNYVAGNRLDRLIDRHGKQTETTVLRLALDVLAAEEHILSHGFLYCDLKPQNIMLTSAGAAVLLDLGLCMPRGSRPPGRRDSVFGSPHYLPPERIWGSGEGPFSEIYSLGMVLFHALTGHPFFDAEDAESLALRHVSRVRLTMDSKLRDTRPGLVELLSRMTRQDWRQRYQTFAEVQTAIRELLPTPAPQA